VPRAHVANVVLLVEEKVRMVVARIALAGRDRDGMKVHTVGLRSLQDGDMLEHGLSRNNRLNHVMQHRVVDCDLISVRPAAHKIAGIFVNRRIRDVRDIGERRQRPMSSATVTQVYRDEVKVPSARQVRLASRNADDLPAR
jgi:hypothetical protein